MYGLRKINKDGKHYDFTWPLEVGAIATAPDWSPEPMCGGGLHVLLNAQGNYNLLDGHYWAVVEFDEAELVMIDSGKGKVPLCKIVHLSESSDGLLEFFRDVQFDSESAYWWVRYIGNREHMRQFINEPYWAYRWALYVGDRDHMRQFITEAQWAYWWAFDIGDRDYMMQFVIGTEYEDMFRRSVWNYI